MSSLSSAVQALEERRASLEAELESVNRQLQSIHSALGTVQRKRGRPAGKRVVAVAARSAGTKKGRTQRWFNPGEAVELMQRLIKQPMRQADVIRQLGVLKGYAGKLDKKAQERFTWAATSALKAALQAKRLIKTKDGKVAIGASK
jgi:hypothetical protein